MPIIKDTAGRNFTKILLNRIIFITVNITNCGIYTTMSLKQATTGTSLPRSALVNLFLFHLTVFLSLLFEGRPVSSKIKHFSALLLNPSHATNLA
jgi:hypothetical protein